MLRGLQFALLLIVPTAILAGVVSMREPQAVGLKPVTYVLKFELPATDVSQDLPPIMGPQDASRPLVVLDPGHGGFDPGAGQGEIKEKAVALQIALEVRAKLLAGGGIRVAMTRDEDRFVTLSERPAIARALGADLFVSIHADSVDNDGANGASVYVLSDRGSSEAVARFAARENRADIVNGVSLSDTNDTVSAILLDLSRQEASESSMTVAQLILRELQGKWPLHYDTVASASLAVLKAPDIPSVLFETGFISNEGDALKLASDEGRHIISDSAAQAIRVFFARKAAERP